jgi:membrane-bound serine protease (ClpP class)
MIHFLANPDLAVLLVLVGILLLYLEFNRPGTVIFACLGTLSAVLGFYGLARHPLSHTAIAAGIIGLALILLELRSPTRNVLAVLGAWILAYALATLMPPPVRIDAPTALAVSIVFAVVTLWLGRIALQARRNKRIRRVD